MKKAAKVFQENEKFEHECFMKTMSTEPSEEAKEFYSSLLVKDKWLIALQYAHDGQLFYLEFAPTIGRFDSAYEAMEFIEATKLPLGWVTMTEKQLENLTK